MLIPLYNATILEPLFNLLDNFGFSYHPLITIPLAAHVALWCYVLLSAFDYAEDWPLGSRLLGLRNSDFSIH